MRKAKATTGRSDIESYYNWVGVTIGNVMKIHGANFEFDYTLHTIPTIRFRMRFQVRRVAKIGFGGEEGKKKKRGVKQHRKSVRLQSLESGDLFSPPLHFFIFYYHFNPTTLQGKSISYSADTKYDPMCYAKLLTQGTINTLREVSLRAFVFDADMIIHESGVPPIHTDAAELDALPLSIKRKLWVVHTHSIPETVVRNGKVCKVSPSSL